MSFTPPTDAKLSVRQPDEGWISCGWLAFEDWRTRNAQTYRQAGEALAVAPAAITGWKNGRQPNEATRRNLQLLAEVEPEAWTWWVRGEDAPEPTVPASEKRPAAPRELGTTRDELWATVKDIDKALGGDLPASHRAQLLGKRASVLTAIARQEDRCAMDEHPDFEAFSEDALKALEATLRHYGVDPTGARTVFAEQLEAAEAARTRRAA